MGMSSHGECSRVLWQCKCVCHNIYGLLLKTRIFLYGRYTFPLLNNL
jgi:hypothetical protein